MLLCVPEDWATPEEQDHDRELVPGAESYRKPEGMNCWGIYRRFSMDYPMHPESKIGNKFPDFELPDQSGTLRKLSHLLRGFPGTLIFGRGYY